MQRVRPNHRTSGVTLGELLAQRDLKLEWASPADQEEHLATAVSAVAVVDIEEPQRYLRGGELLLITGNSFLPGSTSIADYVAKLVGAEVAAVGFGVQPVFAQVPPELVGACREQGLPLLVVPEETPFISVTGRFEKLQEQARVKALQFVSDVARRLTKAAIISHPRQQLLNVLASHTDSFVLLRQGGYLLQAGDIFSRRLAQNSEQMLDEISARASAAGIDRDFTGSITIDGEIAEVLLHHIQPKNSVTDTSFLLLLVKREHISSTDRTAFMLATNLLQLILAIPNAQSIALDQLLMLLLLDEHPADSSTHASRREALIAETLGQRRRRRGYVVLASRSDGMPLDDRDLSFWRPLLATPFVDLRDNRLRAIVNETPSAQVLRASAARGLVIATSTEKPFSELHSGYREASAALEQALLFQGPGAVSTDFRSLGTVVSHKLAVEFAAHTLAPLSKGISSEEYADLTRVLHAWLLHHGSWEQAARVLGLHRNTVRRTVARVAALLGRDLDNALVRADLLFALHHGEDHTR